MLAETPLCAVSEDTAIKRCHNSERVVQISCCETVNSWGNTLKLLLYIFKLAITVRLTAAV